MTRDMAVMWGFAFFMMGWGPSGMATGQNANVDKADQADQAENVLVFVSAFAKGEQGSIWSCHLNLRTGELKPVGKTKGVEQPFFMALGPSTTTQNAARRLYVTHAPGGFGAGKEPEQVVAYSFRGNDGRLQELNRQSIKGAAACYLDVDPTGSSLLVANYTSGDVTTVAVGDDGRLGDSVAYIQHTGSSVNPQRQQEPHAHCIVVSPDGRFALVADLGLDQVIKYQLDKHANLTKPSKQPFVATPPGAGPRHLTFHPDGSHVYVINEIANTIGVYQYAPDSAAMTMKQEVPTLPKNYTGRTHTADVKVTPNGRFVYGTNRGHDSIACFQVLDDGTLKLITIEPSLGKGPQNLAITRDGQYLLCANMPGNSVVVFQIDPSTGKLKSLGKPLEVPMASCIMLAQ